MLTATQKKTNRKKLPQTWRVYDALGNSHLFYAEEQRVSRKGNHSFYLASAEVAFFLLEAQEQHAEHLRLGPERPLRPDFRHHRRSL